MVHQPSHLSLTLSTDTRDPLPLFYRLGREAEQVKCLGIPSDARSQLQRVPPGRLGRPLQRESQGVSYGVIWNDSADPGIQPNDYIRDWPHTHPDLSM